MNNTLIDNRYKYYAFISYKHEDKYWANKLYKDIQTYHLPTEKGKEYKKRKVSPIFIDHHEHSIATYDEAILNNCRQSKYLIVVCSQATKNEPDYINGEIKAFLSANSDSNRVLPFIVGDCENPEKYCFPEELEKLGIIGANINDYGKKILGRNKEGYHCAFLSLMASLLDLKPVDLENFDKKQKKKKRIKAMMLFLTLIAMIIATAIIIWNIRKLTEKMQVDTKTAYERNWVSNENVIKELDEPVKCRISINNLEKEEGNISIRMNENIHVIDGSVILYDNNDKVIEILGDNLFNGKGININDFIDKSDNLYIEFDFTVQNKNLIYDINELPIIVTLKKKGKAELSTLTTIVYNPINVRDYSFSEDKTTIFGWGDSEGGRNSYSDYEVNEGNVLKDKIVFNSISDGSVGNEKGFVCVSRDNGVTNGEWRTDEIYVNHEDPLYLRLYVHNDNPNGMNATAENVKARFIINDIEGKTVGISGLIESTNSSPTEYWDGVVIKSNRKFKIEYIKGSAMFYNNDIGLGGIKISDDVISGEGINLGYDKFDGRIPGGYEYDCFLVIKIRPVFIK